jgi:hypothetical protein
MTIRKHAALAKSVLRIVGTVFAVYMVFVVVVYFKQRDLLFFPTHVACDTMLAPWSDGKHLIGCCHEAPDARNIWLMMHGNAGQAADRDYVLQCMSVHDSLYVLEYPGYGFREGSPSRDSINQAASEAYRLLRLRNPKTPVCVLGESVGSGPACALSLEKIAPDKIVLVVPFDSLANVASERFPFLPARLLLRDRWDNVESLRQYGGPVEIFGAVDDGVIPIKHARALAKQIPNARFIAIPGGHNDWSNDVQVKIRR